MALNLPRDLHPLEEHFLALGHLAWAWTQAELLLDGALIVYVGLQEPGPQRDSIINNVPFRNKIRMIAALGHIHRKSDEQYLELKERLDRLDNEHRPERNRMMHDAWLVSPDQIYRWMRETKIVKPQARELALETSKKVPVSEKDIHLLAARIMADCIDIARLAFQSNAPIVQPPESL